MCNPVWDIEIELGLKDHHRDSEILCRPSIALDKEDLLNYFKETGITLYEIKAKGSRWFLRKSLWDSHVALILLWWCSEAGIFIWILF